MIRRRSTYWKEIALVLGVLWLSILTMQAQNISFKADAPRVVAIGEQFQLTWEVNARGSNFSPPDFSPFRKLQGPATGSSSSVNIINGKTERIDRFTYSYVLVGQTEGKFTLPAASIQVNGKNYQSNTVTIEVVKGNTGNRGKSGAGATGIADDDLFVRVDLSRTKIFQGEQIVATLKVYSRTNNIEFTDAKFPSFDGFYTSEIENTPKQLFRENYRNEVYYVGIFKQLVLIPQRSGTIEIEPFHLSSKVNVQAGYGRDFFGRTVPQYKTLIIDRVSAIRTIEVLPLPSGKPANFSGAVGNFSLRSQIDKTELSANEAINLRYTLQGQGNLKLINPFEIAFPSDLDPFDPKVTDKITTNENGISGSKTFEYLVIPRYAGEFTIPAIQFSYFDTQSKSYKTLTTDSYTILVTKGEEETISYSSRSLNKKEIAFVGEDIRYIKTQNDLRLRQSNVWNRTTYLLTYPIVLVLFLVLFLLLRSLAKQKGNTQLMRQKMANRKALKRLKLASKAMQANQESQFYDELLQAVYGFLSDKLSIPLADLNKERIRNQLEKHQIAHELQENLYNLLDTCEFTRYAPTAGSNQMNELLKEAEQLLLTFEKQLKA